MTRLTDERIASLACQYLGTCKRVFYTKWKDGIDIEYPTLEVEQFARAIEAELSKQEPVAWQERQQLSIGGAWTNWYECPHRPIDSPRQSLLGGVGGIPIEWRPLYTAPLPSAPDTVQVPREPTPEMASAYLLANTEYWDETDKLPPPPGVWRTGTPTKAFVAGYRAMIAARPKE